MTYNEKYTNTTNALFPENKDKIKLSDDCFALIEAIEALVKAMRVKK